MKHISLDLIRVTEAAAISASKLIGSGNKLEIDRVATEAMRDRLNQIDFAGRVVVGEGVKDNGPSKEYGLYAGECVGKLGVPHCGCSPSAGTSGEFEQAMQFAPPIYNLAMDPVDGTTQAANGGTEAMAVLAVAQEGCMYSPQQFYMLKLACGRHIKDKVSLSVSDPIERTIELVSKATGKNNAKIMVCVLNRPRHETIIAKLRELGVRIKLIQDCDVSGAVATCRPESGVDLFYGIGGSPEAILSAAAIKCMRGDFQATEVDSDWQSVGRTLYLDDLIKGECAFVATGITNGSFLDGVRWDDGHIFTHSVFMRSASGTVRWLNVKHG